MPRPELCKVAGIIPSINAKIEIRFDGPVMSITAVDLDITGDGECSKEYALLMGLSNALSEAASELLASNNG